MAIPYDTASMQNEQILCDHPGIAIIGMSCRFPGANTPEDFWKLLSQGRTTFRSFPSERACFFEGEDLSGIRGTFLDDPFLFDNHYFNIPDEEARYMDPQQRIMLELAIEAMEYAGYRELRNRAVGVFIGANQMSYQEALTQQFYRKTALQFLSELPEYRDIPEEARRALQAKLETWSQTASLPSHALVGNLINMIPGRISHEMNLTGPSLATDTACSSSLVAVHLACESLLRDECRLCFAGGINLNLTPSIFRYMEAAGVISPSGRCIPFSGDSDGILLGEGAGMVLLKKLPHALEDGDPVLAVIRSSGINNDGRSLSAMAPSWKGQLALLRKIYQEAGVDPMRISALEAHGTSTRIGDSVEISVIERFFSTKSVPPLSVGSVKSNIGHTLGAAGIAGLQKMILALQHRQLPPSPHLSVNPKWQLEQKGIQIQASLQDWTSEGLRMAGINSFGFGGTNAHLILEEAVTNTPLPDIQRTTFRKKSFVYPFLSRTAELTSLLYKVTWQPSGPYEPDPVFQPEHWLILGNREADVDSVRKHLSAIGWSCYAATGDNSSHPSHFMRTGEYEFVLNTSDRDHIRWLFDSLPSETSLGLVFLGDRSPQNDADPGALIRNELSAMSSILQESSRRKAETRTWVASFHAYAATSDEPLIPGNRALAVLTAAAFAENESLRGALVDLPAGSDHWKEDLAAVLGSIPEHPLVIREGQYYLPALHAAGSAGDEKPSLSIRPDGVYLVAGGSSGVGAAIAAHIHREGAGRVIVSGTRTREELPPELQSLLSKGLEYVACSVLSETALEEMIKAIVDRLGRLDGIVFAPGKVAFGSMLKRERRHFEEILQTKITGATFLKQALADREPGFVLLVSSMSSLSPVWSKGMAEYAAANAFLEALAESENQQGHNWIACSWAAWENTGMAKDLSGNYSEKPGNLGPDEALSGFSAALLLNIPHLAVLPSGEAERFSFSYPPSALPIPFREKTAPVSQAINEGTDYKTILLKLISDELELPAEQIDEQASFYDLGLDSLSAVDIVGKFEAQSGLSLNATLLFEHDSIALLTAYLQSLHTDLNTPNPDNPFPLLPAQRTFFAQQHIHPFSPCNMLVRVEFDYAFDPEKLQQAWHLLIQHHDALRLAFFMTEEGPRQAMRPLPELSVEYHSPEGEKALRTLEDQWANHIFTLEDPPLFRLHCATLGKDRSALILVMHHILADGWSLNLLVKDLLKLYHQPDRAEPHNPLSFRQYAATGSSPDNGRKLTDKAYWIRTLAGAPATLALPYKHQNGDPGEYLNYTEELDAEATLLIQDLARKWKVTTFHCLLAAYFFTLRQFSGQDDIIIRVAQANRERALPGLDSLAGCLADSIPLRLQWQAVTGLENLSRKVKDLLLEGQKHNSLSGQDFAALDRSAPSAGPAGYSPAGISFIPVDPVSAKTDTSFRHIHCRSALPFSDISLICTIHQGKLACSWNYASRKFDEATIKGMSAAYLEQLRGAVMPPKTSTVGFPPLEWPAKRLFPETSLLHEKVWAACERYLGRTAVVENGQQLTYHSLKESSFQIANTLLEHTPLSPGLTGILAYPGAAAVCGILGILGAGRAFVPFDPDWPDGRIEAQIRHSRLQTLLTTHAFLARLIANPTLASSLKTVVLLDKPSGALPPTNLKILHYYRASNNKPEALPEPLTPDDLAYVMYTSGTSGQPKGVMVQHRAVEVFLDWIAETFEPGPSDRFIHTSSLGFGGSIRQIFSTLLAGATIFPIPRLEMKDPERLLAFLEENRITLLNTVPTVLHHLNEYLGGMDSRRARPTLPHLRAILVGGETLLRETVEKWRSYFGAKHAIYNLYGSTETIVNATLYLIGQELPETRGGIPIGRPKKGSLVRLVNENGQWCQPGEVGELYVGGPCLAKGYLGQEALTRERFVSLDHLGMGGVFYRTGDLASMDETGLFHFHGRNDDQIQIYGNRVELAEVEDAIYQTQKVKSAVVTDFKTNTGHWLIAFVVLNQQDADTPPEAIRDFVADCLPPYMRPHRVILLKEMPVNTAGKIDRKALRQTYRPDFGETPNDTDLSPTEEKVATLWKSMLHLDTIQPNDDFFQMGGDSILALEMLFRLRKDFSRTPPALTLFRERTLRSFAKAIDQALEEDREEQWKPEAGESPQLSYAQRGFLIAQKIKAGASFNWTALLRLEGDIDPSLLSQSFDRLVQRHAMLRTVFIGEGAQVRQQTQEVQAPDIPFLDISREDPSSQKAILNNEWLRLRAMDFELSSFPLFALHLFRLGPTQWTMAIGMHHIICDAWSLQVLTRELLQVYDQLRENRQPVLPGHPAPYSLAVSRETALEKSLTPAQLGGLRQFWIEKLQGMPPTPPPTGPGEPLKRIWSARRKDQLRDYCRKHNTTLFQCLLGAFARSLGVLYPEHDTWISLPESGRELPFEGIQHTVGCLARNLTIRIPKEKRSDLPTAMHVAENAFREASEHRDIPPKDFLAIAAKSAAGGPEALLRFYFSFMDFSSLATYPGQHIQIDWEGSEYHFEAGGTGVELMLSLSVQDSIRIRLSGFAPLEKKERLLNTLEETLKELFVDPDHIDTALIAYLPGKAWLRQILPGSGPGPDAWSLIRENIFPDKLPRLVEKTTTPLGTSGLILLPLDAEELQEYSSETLAIEIANAVELAARKGAAHVSLAGILPSRTHYCFSVQKELEKRKAHLPAIHLTSGHASTVVAVVRTVEKALNALQSDIRRLKVAILGFGSIGQASLSLLLDVIGHPASLIIADLAAQWGHLEAPLAALRQKYSGPLKTIGIENASLPQEACDAGLIIGASSSGNILPVEMIRSGTVLVDDSFPPVVAYKQAIQRMKTAEDVLLLGGGKLSLGEVHRQLTDAGIPAQLIQAWLRELGDDGMPGCRVEPMLRHAKADLPPTLGLVNHADARLYWDQLDQLGIQAAELHLGGFTITPSLLEKVRHFHHKNHYLHGSSE